jgi:hypothetical protein
VSHLATMVAMSMEPLQHRKQKISNNFLFALSKSWNSKIITSYNACAGYPQVFNPCVQVLVQSSVLVSFIFSYWSADAVNFIVLLFCSKFLFNTIIDLSKTALLKHSSINIVGDNSDYSFLLARGF